MFDHFTTQKRAYSSALIYYLVLSELDHVDHAATTTFVRIKVDKVDLNVDKQRIWLYQHGQQFVKLPPIW